VHLIFYGSIISSGTKIKGCPLDCVIFIADDGSAPYTVHLSRVFVYTAYMTRKINMTTSSLDASQQKKLKKLHSHKVTQEEDYRGYKGRMLYVWQSLSCEGDCSYTATKWQSDIFKKYGNGLPTIFYPPLVNNLNDDDE
jgi:hypothetical protein